MRLEEHIISSHQEDEILARNIKKLISFSNMTEVELARRAVIPQPTLHKILSGDTSNPRISTIRLLANYFNISVDDLYGDNILEIIEKPKVHYIPIISWNDCIKGTAYTHNLSSSNWQAWIITEVLGESMYALTSKPSMEPQFPRKTILIVNPAMTPIDGDLIVVHYKGTESATVRELSIDGPDKALISLNQKTKNANFLDENVTFLGVIIQTRFSYYDEKQF